METGLAFSTLRTITADAAARWRGQATDPRSAQLMGSLVEHLHAFARENALTMDEWTRAIGWLERAGQISDDKRKELILASDVLGLSMLLELMHDHAPDTATQATLLGPFFIADSPTIEHGARLPGVADSDGIPLVVAGRILDTAGAPVADASIDTWQTDHEGFYEAQIDAGEAHLRARLRSRGDGSYMFRTVVPVDYSIPLDGPVGELLAVTSISPMRPAHLHFRIEAPGHAPLVTHVFDRASARLDSDVVFGTRDGLLVELVDRAPGRAPNGDAIDRAWKQLALDFVLA